MPKKKKAKPELVIIKGPHPKLLRKSISVTDYEGVYMVAKEMFRLMYKNKGIGLAAPQVGMTRRFFIIDVGEGSKLGKQLIINPEIIEVGEAVDGVEGCLSFPGKIVGVVRPEKVKFRFEDAARSIHEVEVEGLEARCVLHEYDHLEGKVIF